MRHVLNTMREICNPLLLEWCVPENILSVSSAWTSDATWRRKSWSPLAKLIIVVFSAPSNYLNQWCYMVHRYFCEIGIKILKFSFMKMHMTMSSEKISFSQDSKSLVPYQSPYHLIFLVKYANHVDIWVHVFVMLRGPVPHAVMGCSNYAAYKTTYTYFN